MTADVPAYPLSLRIAGRRVVVVGGGPVAARRALGLVEAEADVHLVSPEVTPEIAALADAGRITWLPREYRDGDLDGTWLVHTATGDRSVDERVAADADAAQVWCVRASAAGVSSAWVPAVARVGDVVVAVNAGGDPRRAIGLRTAIAEQLRTGRLPLRHHRRREGGGTVGIAGGRAGDPSPGTVALVGGGPGHPDLLTVRGRTLLAEADVVVVDRLAPRAVLDELDPDVLVIDVGKLPGLHAVPQDAINALLVEHARAGRRVVRLKGGDPYVFGRGSEEAAFLRAAGIPVEVVPGVTSAVSVPAAAGIPVTHRGLSRGFTVLTGHEDLHTVPPSDHHTVVLLMGVAALSATCDTLVAYGHRPDTPVAIVEDGYGPGQRVTTGTLTTIAARAVAAGVRSPAVTVIGDVVRLAPAWAQQAQSRGMTPVPAAVSRTP